MASDILKSVTDIAEEATSAATSALSKSPIAGLAEEAVADLSKTATSAAEGVLGIGGDIAQKTIDRLLGNKEEDSLKYLQFVQLAAIFAVFSLSKLNDYVKNNSGPLKPAIQTIESTVKTVVTPIYPTFEDVFNKVLKFADNQGRSYRRQLFDEIFDFSEDDSLFAEDVEEDESAGDQDMNEGGIRAVANTNAIEEGPLTGMLFPCISTMFNFYKEHARLKGFSVFKRSAVNVRGGSRKYQTISCDKGRKAIGAKSSKRINCPAKINAILRENGMWQISKVISSHNHELEPSMSRLMVAHRSLNMDMKRRLEANDIAGIRPAKSIRLLEVQAGGPENLSCLSKDCRNFIERKRRLRLGDGDAEAIRKLFVRMQRNDPEFFYSFDLDDDSRLSNVLWVHPRSRAAYEEFNDVVSFDTTYLVNRYKLPFATIVGVNHHGQSILLGCALISHEDVNTFKWLFMTWLEAMEDVHPNSILTDQCESMRKAIREVMPNTRHRFCLWHILCKVPEKFKGVTDYDSACLEFKAVIYDSLTIEMFERNWNEFVVKHGLERNEWLSKLYVDREYWVPIYLNHTFWAGMVSTQRSESMHAYFDGYVNSMSTLKQFVEQYEIAMCDKNEKEFYADFKSKTQL
ncbi:hypothetical protein GH714_003442 [Hevea brasiliensis]|uniref:Uncharacterized protein n=1 Tax=Hevea brasiliensis TaxID=3981 RepID=A0A6A6LW93_HEVBR|nr:hypothetical protein GH714_003442 [Hevea brasiliensis]